MNPDSTPDRIMQLGIGFWGSKTLLTAIEFGLVGPDSMVVGIK